VRIKVDLPEPEGPDDRHNLAAFDRQADVLSTWKSPYHLLTWVATMMSVFSA
jgi:hypothetical protein